VFQYWRTKLEQACVDCFAPQISGWNDSDGEPARPGTGLEGWQTRIRRGTLSVNLGSNPGPGRVFRLMAGSQSCKVVNFLTGITARSRRVADVLISAQDRCGWLTHIQRIPLGGRSPSSFLRLIDALANENIWFEIECRVELLIVVSFDVRLLC
jgi:hypothetical protein